MTYVEFLDSLRAGITLFVDSLGSVTNALLGNYIFITILGITIFSTCFIWFFDWVLSLFNSNSESYTTSDSSILVSSEKSSRIEPYDNAYDYQTSFHPSVHQSEFISSNSSTGALIGSSNTNTPVLGEFNKDIYHYQMSPRLFHSDYSEYLFDKEHGEGYGSFENWKRQQRYYQYKEDERNGNFNGTFEEWLNQWN